MDTLFGLPAHVLLVHAVVVLGPLAALLGIAVAVRPRWAFYLRWPLLVLTVISTGLAVLAADAGEDLQRRLGGNALIEQHAEAGDLLKVVAIGYLVVTVLAFFAIAVRSPLASGRGEFRTRLPAVAAPVARVLLAAVAVWFIVQTVITGHTGSEAAWKDIVQSTSPGSGGDGD
ncbi:DUF2231 domain-containing protein [Cumulibacter manganitolerans]|uniref:DUF2231 domain-containing protein n=1 Tax=Cumulibacter manganitolerans TaxID=1884992 RepID=UPI0012958025|nr:DUF2231 domain-containing protein [Cumulibacter manganitolerans]